MERIPRNYQALTDYYATRQTVWSTHRVALGLPAAAVTGLADDLTEVQSSLLLQRQAQAAARAATLRYNDALDRLKRRGAQLVKTIDTTATAQTDPDSVYALAQVAPPATPRPTAAPEAPSSIVFSIEPGGALAIRFKSRARGGRSFWNVERKLPGQPFFTAIGGTPVRTFIDSTLPAGTDFVTYRIRGQTGTQTGAWSQETTVSFGVGGGGGVSVSALSTASDANTATVRAARGKRKAG